ncbi:MAG: polysaccharide deacetylase family protein [Verrucomicrobiota bacterium]
MGDAAPQLAIKIDVDTYRGTREGVPALVALLKRMRVPATFLFSLGPDNTGRAITRIFRPGFFKKVSRTNVTKLYGYRTLLSGTLLPAPHIGRRCEALLRQVRDQGFPVGIHCHDHYRWQDHLAGMSLDETRREFQQAVAEFERVFGEPPQTAGAPGWQTTVHSLQAYDEAHLLYASDCRGTTPFLPRAHGLTFRTPQIPTTLPTLDELLGRPEYPDAAIVPHYLKLLRRDTPNILTSHAEIEGNHYLGLFEELLAAAQRQGVQFTTMEALAADLAKHPQTLPICDVAAGTVDGRSGTVTVQLPAA